METPTSGGINFAEHRQNSAATIWTITHNFQTSPLVDINVYEGSALRKAFPLSVIHTSSTTIEVKWSSPQRGIATLAAALGT